MKKTSKSVGIPDSPDAVRERSRKAFVAWLIESCILIACTVYTEVVLHFLVFGEADERIQFKILFAFCFGLIAVFIASFLPGLLRRIFMIVAVSAATVLAEIQLVYHAVFGNLMPLNLTRMGGNVFKNFGSQIGYAITNNLARIILLALPVFGVIAAAIIMKKKATSGIFSPRCRILAGGALVASIILVWSALFSVKDVPQSAYTAFTDPGTGTDTSYKTLGMWPTTVQEARYMLFGSSGDLPLLISGDEEDGVFSSDKYNVIDGLDFKTLAGECGEGEDSLGELDRFFATERPTEKNEYTGKLAGYNVITFCAESYSPYFISEELTPTLYEMTHHGFVFENYYGTFPSVTTNGEYTMCMGLLPDMTRTKTQSSFDVSIGHYLPFCLGNALREEGYVTYAYHNYLGDFYNRNITHPNMGYDFKSVGQGLDITLSWPASDEEMITASVGDYVSAGTPFHAYYMTFSGHYQYNWENAMSLKHKDEVADLPYSDEVKAFVACNLEVEHALTALLERLKAEGVAEKTLIVLTNDHYPYGLSEEQYDELAGREIDTVFEKYRNSFICYVPGMEDVIVDEYCSTADILPTVLNLLGVNYDSRILAGTDVLAPGDHAAILADGSFITKDFRYNSETGEVIPTDPDAEIDTEEVDRFRSMVTNKFGISTRILNSDYYAHVFGKDPVGEHDAVVFYDIDDVFNQNYVNFLYRLGFVDADGKNEFGAKRAEEFGELLDMFYRMAGKPEPEGFVPAWYDPDGGKTADSKWRDAVIWAAANDVIKPTDGALPGPEEQIDCHLLIKTFYRAAAALGADTDKNDHAAVEKAKEANPDMDPELLTAVEYMLYHRIYTGFEGTLEGLLHPDDAENTFSRERTAAAAFKFYTTLIDKTGK